MKLRNVERFEIVVGRFDLRPFDNREADMDEDALDLLEDLPDDVA